MFSSGRKEAHRSKADDSDKRLNKEMNSFLKIVGLIFLPVALLVFLFAIISGGAGKQGKNFFIKEFDEQNIYG